jgi:hypothetical protein
MTNTTDLPALRRAAEFTREDLGESGTNYPHVRTLLAFAEAALAASAPSPEVMLNGLTEAETNATASVAGLVGAPSRAGEALTAEEAAAVRDALRLAACEAEIAADGKAGVSRAQLMAYGARLRALAAKLAIPPAQPEVRWCTSCGEGVTSFCRGDKQACPTFGAQPEVREAPSESALMQILHDPENQPSQYGTVPMGWLDKPTLNDAESDAVRMQMAALLDGVAVALRGDPGARHRWSWHDLPDRVAAAMSALQGAMQVAASARGTEVREALTDEQRQAIAQSWRGRSWTVGDIIDAIERAHGIGQPGPKGGE